MIARCKPKVTNTWCIYFHVVSTSNPHGFHIYSAVSLALLLRAELLVDAVRASAASVNAFCLLVITSRITESMQRRANAALFSRASMPSINHGRKLCSISARGVCVLGVGWESHHSIYIYIYIYNSNNNYL